LAAGGQVEAVAGFLDRLHEPFKTEEKRSIEANDLNIG
jgi:hypothetical protein